MQHSPNFAGRSGATGVRRGLAGGVRYWSRARAEGIVLAALLLVVAWPARWTSFCRSCPITFGVSRVSAAERTLWVLAVGVSRYRERGMALRFAEADARAIAKELRRQADSRLYGKVRVRLLTDAQVTRESVVTAMQDFLGQARRDDVVVIFMAGHGVQDRRMRSYYFLPYGATFATLLTKGLRMSDIDVLVRAIRRDVGRVVLMLDTCHAGAFDLAPGGITLADDLAGRVSTGEGLYLLAATTPGEKSRERSDLGHGIFTMALIEGLRGAADSDRDGVVSVSDLFSYVARRVAAQSGGRQHPYHKMEGTDLILAAVTGAPGGVTPTAAPETVARLSGEERNAVAVMNFHNLRGDSKHDWIGRALRAALNTELSKVRELNVYSPELLDWSSRRRHVGVLETARDLGVSRMITGSFAVLDDAIRIDVSIVDAGTGKNLPGGSDHVEGALRTFFELQNALTLAVLRRLEVEVTPREGALLNEKKNTRVDALRLLLDAEQGPVGTPASRGKSKSGHGPQSQRSFGRWWLPAAAVAAETPVEAAAPSPVAAAGDTREQVRKVLEIYRRAQEMKDLDRLAEVYDSFSDEHRAAVASYLATVRDLHVELADLKIEPAGDHVIVSYTRHDRFTDSKSGEAVHLEVRLTKILVRQSGKWRIAVLPR